MRSTGWATPITPSATARAPSARSKLVLKNYPDSPKAPDAMLNIASCYTELKDKANATKTLKALIARYPDSSAAQTAKERGGKK